MGNSPTSHSVLNAFLQEYHGVFHEDDFVKYAKQMRDSKTQNDLLILSLMLPSCIRLSEYQWITQKDFFTQDVFSEDEWQKIEHNLLNYIGNKPFLPVNDLPQAFFDDLKPLRINGKIYYWNEYMLTSVAQFHLKQLKITNTTVAPYAITGAFVPLKAPIDWRSNDEVIDYFLQFWPRQFGVTYSANDAFDFLKTHNIRLRGSKNLLEYLEGWLKEHPYV